MALMPRVLIVDDEKEVCKLLKDILDNASIPNAAADTVARAVEISEGFQPNVALVDLIIPETGGLDLAEQLTEQNPGIRIILTTGSPNADLQLGDLARKAGVDSILSKPLHVAEVLREIKGSEEE